MNKTKLCYVLPEYDAKTATHFAHNYGFVEEISKIFDVFLIIEKGGAHVNFKGKFYVQKFRWPLCRFLENFLVFKILRFKGYKNFYIHYSFLSAFSASLVVKILGGRVFYWNCGLPWNYKRKFLRGIFEKTVYRLISFLVTGTEGLKNEYAKHYKISLDKIKVMPNWIETEKIQISKSKFQKEELKKKLNIENKKVVFFAHRLSKRKGAHFLPEILRGLKDENVILLIAGEGPEKESIETRIKDDNLSEKVIFLGQVPNEEIYKFYFISDVFIMPSEEEGFPHVLLEAMASGVPFVAYNIGGVKEIVSPEFYDYTAKIGDIKDFVLKIKKILNLPPDELARLKSVEINWIKKYDIKNVIDIFNNLIYNKKYIL